MSRYKSAHYGVTVVQGIAHSLARAESGFSLKVEGQIVQAATVLLATGVLDRKPPIPDLRAATLAGAIRWCPICDGYEVQDQRVGLLSSAADGYRHALFLRNYTNRLSWFVEDDDRQRIDHAELDHLRELNIQVIQSPVKRIRVLTGPEVMLSTADGRHHVIDTLYPMVGCQPRVELLDGLDARQDECQQLWVDQHQQTSIAGIYAAGDVVHALNQMSVGAAHAATAATAIHNSLPRQYR